MSNYYAIVYSNSELSHYGVPGMKWGVRKMAQYAGRTAASTGRLINNVKSKGALKGAYQWHAQNVSRRLNSMSDKRKKHMSARQRASYKQSKEYWNAKAAGKTNKELKKEGSYRGVIKRTYDSYRSRSLSTRAGVNFVNSLYSTTVSGHSLKESVPSSAVSTVIGLAGDELVSKLFGHY